jgi:hypothetical protein
MSRLAVGRAGRMVRREPTRLDRPGTDPVRLPRVKFTVRRMMVTAALVAACLSFAARADHLRRVAKGRVQHSSAQLARGLGGRPTPEAWREYQEAEADLHKADFLESFGIVVTILVPFAGLAVLLWPGRRGRTPDRGGAETRPACLDL